MIGYDQIIESKTHSSIKSGIKSLWMPDKAFDFQKAVADRNIEMGRYASFLDTGLGKTLIQLIIASNYVRHTNKPVLIATPLAVAYQFLSEAEKFGVDDVAYSKDGKYKNKIVLCNYERLHYFDKNDFDCFICDESSILKNSEGATRNAINSFMRKTKYRFLATATPSPNNYVELGTSSEALGNLGYTDMLTKYFVNNEDTISPVNIGTEWRLKEHAIEHFFKWVASWSISMRKPSDLGFSDEGYILPELIENYHTVVNEKTMLVNGQTQLFAPIAKSNSDIRNEVNATITQRCELAANLCEGHDISVVWCNRNAEGDLLEKIIPNAHQLKGTMSIEEKEDILISFSKQQIKKLITKSKITAFGQNWQHCNHTVFFPTFSQEQKYQALRRFYRFGQKRNVTADIVYSKGMQRIVDSINAKDERANHLFSILVKMMNEQIKNDKKEFDKQIIKPSFI